MTPADAVAALRARVEGLLQEHFGTYAVDPEGDFSIEYESARVFVCPRPWQEEKTVVLLFSVTNVDIDVTPELTRFLLMENLNLLFGHFAVNVAERQVWFAHTLLGDFLDPEELVTALSTVAMAANKYDNIIQDRFGGRLYTEAS